jgi:hypothetical protein
VEFADALYSSEINDDLCRLEQQFLHWCHLIAKKIKELCEALQNSTCKLYRTFCFSQYKAWHLKLS